MKKIYDFLANIPSDKYAHILVSIIITAALFPIAMLMTSHAAEGLFLASMLGLSLGLAKEMYDSRHEDHNADSLDFLADTAGVVICITIITISIMVS